MLAEKLSLLRRPAEMLTIIEFDRQAGHALRGIDGEADRLLGSIQIDDDAGFDAARFLVTDTEDFDAVGTARQMGALLTRTQTRDDAAYLARTNIKNCQGAGPLCGCALQSS